VTPERLAALGAFCSGFGAAITAILGTKRARRRAEEDCEKRFEAFREGLKVAHEEADRAAEHDHS